MRPRVKPELDIEPPDGKVRWFGLLEQIRPDSPRYSVRCGGGNRQRKGMPRCRQAAGLIQTRARRSRNSMTDQDPQLSDVHGQFAPAGQARWALVPFGSRSAPFVNHRNGGHRAWEADILRPPHTPFQGAVMKLPTRRPDPRARQPWRTFSPGARRGLVLCLTLFFYSCYKIPFCILAQYACPGNPPEELMSASPT
jgi:hypothetical protein